MRAVIQRVSEAEVTCSQDGSVQTVGKIGPGLLVLLGIENGDTSQIAEKLLKKISTLRVFPDSEGKLNLSLLDTKGELLVVSQFTLMADMRKGTRPSFSRAAPPSVARELYEVFVQLSQSQGIPTQTGRFQADMNVRLINQGPVTLILDVAPEAGQDTE